MSASLSEQIGALLRARHASLSTAESCTGGLLGHLITNTPGSSDYYMGGVVAYAYEAKTALLGISQEFLLAHGAVSEQTARAMANGIRDRLNSDISISITGILGPGGGLPNKPVGLVYIAMVTPESENCQKFTWNGNRDENKQASAKAALELLHEYLTH